MPKVQGQIVAPPVVAGPPVDPDKVILTIGTTKMTAGEYNSVVDALPTQYQAFARGAGKRQFAENLIQVKILAEEADKRHLEDQPKVRRQIAFQRQDLLARAMFEQLQASAAVDPAQVQAYYDAHKNDYESVLAKHILVRVKGAPMPAPEGKPELTDEQALAKAQDIRKRLEAGADFAALAKAESDDSSAAQGGELDEFHRGMMVPPFEQAAFSLKAGTISEPVKSPFGYHIIVVREHKTKTLAEAKPEIEKALRPEMARKEVEAMRAKTAVEFDDSFFGPAQPAPLPPAVTPPAAR